MGCGRSGWTVCDRVGGCTGSLSDWRDFLNKRKTPVSLQKGKPVFFCHILYIFDIDSMHIIVYTVLVT
ncbi:hypothetical protein JCM17039_13160 [Blautia glucerasea]